MPDVITIGSATRDVFVKSVAFDVHESEGSSTGVEGCFPLGAKIEIDDLVFETGGGATNAAVTFARLGFSSAVVGSIGDDPGGREVTEALDAENVSTSLMQRHHEYQTGYSIIIVAGTGERTILVFRGASKRFDADLVPWGELRSKWLYMTSLGGDIDLAARVIDHAGEHGIRVAWNPGTTELSLGISRLAPLIKNVDAFNVNREEAALLSGKDRKDLEGIFGDLRNLPRHVLIVTDGLGGTYAATAEEILHAGVIEVPRVNTTGAGDAFGSGFVAGLLTKDDIRYALAVGTWNATGVVQDMGAKRGLLRRLPPDGAIEKVTIAPWN